MDKINTKLCQPLKWYHHEDLGRLLCVHVDAKSERGTFVTPKVPGPIDFKVMELLNYNVTPLPDCTGWDWQPPPKYRPFKDAWEFIEQAKSRKIMLGDREMKVRCLDFCSADFGSTSVMLCDPSGHNRLYSFKDLCDQFTFADTNAPCGVKL